MAIDFLDLAPLEAVEWTVSVKDKDGNDQEITIFPFDTADIAYVGRNYSQKVRCVFYEKGTVDPVSQNMELTEAQPLIVAIALLGPARLRDKTAFNAVVAKFNAMPPKEKVRLFDEIWKRNFSTGKEDNDDPPPKTAAEVLAEAGVDAPSPSP